MKMNQLFEEVLRESQNVSLRENKMHLWNLLFDFYKERSTHEETKELIIHFGYDKYSEGKLFLSETEDESFSRLDKSYKSET
jgi:hypothetical protein